jgi:hypothetical protein
MVCVPHSAFALSFRSAAACASPSSSLTGYCAKAPPWDITRRKNSSKVFFMVMYINENVCAVSKLYA